MSKAKRYILETSSDGKKWVYRAGWEEGQPSRWGDPMSPEIMLKEARSFIDHWRPLHDGYDQDVKKEISDRSHVRVIIEL